MAGSGGPLGSIWLESAFCQDEGCHAMRFSDPVAEVVLHRPDGLRRFFAGLEEWLGRGFHLAGWLDYEAGMGFEPECFPAGTDRDDDRPIGWFGVFGAPERFTAEEAGALNLSQDLPDSSCVPDAAVYDLSFSVRDGEYSRKIEAVRREIAAGNVYQVNFTGRYRFRTDLTPSALYSRLRLLQPSSFSACINAAGRSILSFSPELFFSKRGPAIDTMPMKGTAPRGTSPVEDRSFLSSLSGSGKDRAENLMIVDLLRNDLGRICRPGSVKVQELFAMKTWPTLHQMVSRIGGELRAETGLYDIFRALFPCGSITGAPKLSSMQLIGRLEDSPRGAYTGTIGWISPGRDMVFSVAIRTVELSDGAGVYGAGGGIVWDSKPLGELAECRLKAAIIGAPPVASIGLFESILWNGEYVWLDEHCRRLGDSAVVFGIPFSEADARRALRRLEGELHLAGPRFKVRLDLSPTGGLSAAAVPVTPHEGMLPLRLCIPEERIDSLNPILRHKTTLREFYDRRYRLALDEGFDEVLFLNERLEVAEGAVSTVFIRKGGNLFTPPLSAGILDGVFRAYMLRTRPEIRQQSLTLRDLLEADAIFVANAVRGMRRGLIRGRQVETGLK
ncbi:aminodeoxychorismate synthase component I [Pelodictyon luteolum]|uniref:Para-aminobenzoate synthase, component I n=1 Tax=Chlorobium luteolum (strain DSM 273 / BCRC 81028 / 2530) TaxID=319225 RepID=Q3B294_CHLL3|nr:aminodeoxychorismate synthase component I [Pelodictyon luteolum]ABB24537.1 Para-aminobenzoate synthase, component I [Pelodictyon luteolum DSM 273]